MHLINSLRELHERYPLLWKVVYILSPICILLVYIPSGFFPKQLGVGWISGLTGGIIVYCLHLLRLRFHSQPTRRLSVSGNLCNVSFAPINWIYSISYVAIFCGTVAFLKYFDISWQHFNEKGFLLISYSICRFVLAIYLLVLCSTLGALVARFLFPGIQSNDISDGAFFTFCFFGGAAIYGIVFTGIGLFGFLKLPVALILTIPILFFSPAFTNRIVSSFCIRAYNAYANVTKLNSWVYLSSVWCLLITVVLLLASSGLYPGVPSNDVWEHYMQYYREVLHDGSVGPNEIWYHFYVSKGAGLFFLSGLLSDNLSAQLVSWCFVFVTGFIVFQLSRKFLGSASWAILSSILFYAVYRGDFFKHHDVMSGYIAFLVWGSIESRTDSNPWRGVFYLFMGLVAFYIGFYQPIVASIIAVYWGILILLILPFRTLRSGVYFYISLIIVLSIGIFITLGVNYYFTGMAEAVPIKFFWKIADNLKFRQIFGYSGIAYLLFTETGNLVIQPWFKFNWLVTAFRYQYLVMFLPPILAIVGGVVGIFRLVWKNYGKKDQSNALPLSVFVAFFLTILIFSSMTYSASFMRLLVFTTFFTTLVVVIFLKMILDIFSSDVTRPWVYAIFISLLSIHAFSQEFWYFNNVRSIRSRWVLSYLSGRRSFADVLYTTDKGLKSPLQFQTITEIRRILGPERKIMNLGYDPGPGYSFPGAGLFAEVDCSLGPDHLDIVFGSPEKAKSVLKSLELDFFLLNIQSNLFNSIVFGNLFHPLNLNKYFKIIFHKENNYLLTWRSPEDTEPIDPKFAQIMELKQRGLLYYPSSPEFKQQIEILIMRDLPAWKWGNTAALIEVALLLRLHMMDDIILTENRALINDLITFISAKLHKNIHSLIAEVKKKKEFDSLEGKEYDQLFHKEMAGVVIMFIKSWVGEYCEKEFEPGLARTLVNTDERKSFGQIYTSKQEVQDFLAEMKEGLFATPFEYY